MTAALDSAPTLNTLFPQSQLEQQLQTVARLIAVRDPLGFRPLSVGQIAVRDELQMQRQIFFVAAD